MLFELHFLWVIILALTSKRSTLWFVNLFLEQNAKVGNAIDLLRLRTAFIWRVTFQVLILASNKSAQSFVLFKKLIFIFPFVHYLLNFLISRKMISKIRRRVNIFHCRYDYARFARDIPLIFFLVFILGKTHFGEGNSLAYKCLWFCLSLP